MFKFWVFFCPRGGDRDAAKRGDILCPHLEMWADCVEKVLDAFPTAVRIHRV